MELFGDTNPESILAINEDGRQLTYGDLSTYSNDFLQTVGGRTLIFLLCENSPSTLFTYLACLRTGIVPLLLDAHIDATLLTRLITAYQPAYLCHPDGISVGPDTVPIWQREGGVLVSTGLLSPTLHPDLTLLLATSGSTGSPKLVRLSSENLGSNARSIAEYLMLNKSERPVTNLPMSYSYGMSIVNSHLLVGATLCLTRHSLMERGFWDLIARERVTSLAGVPYTYQILKRLGFMNMELPALHTLTQAGGKLTATLHKEFAMWAQQTERRFFVMYGQTEAGPRMGYLPAEQAVARCGSMGIAIPNGKFYLQGEDGTEVTEPETAGELVYEGLNVAMGYALCGADLSKGDEWGGRLITGDMAQRDRDGFYYIIGRKKRFLKLFGNRVNLDETERILMTQFPETQFACVGRDDSLVICTDSRDPMLPTMAADYLSQCTHLPRRGFLTQVVTTIPKNEAGKILYATLGQSNDFIV